MPPPSPSVGDRGISGIKIDVATSEKGVEEVTDEGDLGAYN